MKIQEWQNGFMAWHAWIHVYLSEHGLNSVTSLYLPFTFISFVSFVSLLCICVYFCFYLCLVWPEYREYTIESSIVLLSGTMTCKLPISSHWHLQGIHILWKPDPSKAYFLFHAWRVKLCYKHSFPTLQATSMLFSLALAKTIYLSNNIFT